MKLLPVLAAMVVAVPVFAADRPPLYLGGGVTKLDKDVRDLTNDWPWTIAAGWGESEAALFGAPSIDLEWTHAQGHGNKFDTYGVTYNERAMISDSLYFGAGVGSYYSKIKATDDQGTVYDQGKWFPAARGILGLNLGGGRYGAFFTEIAYTYRGKVDGLSANGFSLIAGLWF